MYRVFYNHKQFGRYCVRTFPDNYTLPEVISQIKSDLTAPKYHNTHCEVLDDSGTILWEYNPIKKKREKEKKMTEQLFSKYLLEIMLRGGIDCCSICKNGCDNQLCDNADEGDISVCWNGMRDYANKQKI